jgi:hypothetical protein
MSGEEDKRQWMNLPNRASQKSRAFHMEVVAEPTLNVHAQFTPPTLVFKQYYYLEYIYIYYALLAFKFWTHYITFYELKVANTANLGCSSRFAGSNKIYRARHTAQALPNS